MSHPGRTLRELRQARDLTLRDLADRVYLHWSTVQKIELGQRTLTLDVARALDVALTTGGILAALVLEGSQPMLVDDPVITRIAPQRYHRGKARITYLEEAAAAGRTAEVDHVTERIAASDRIADRLGIHAGDPVQQTRYMIRMNGKLVTASYSWEPFAITGGTVIEDPHAGPYADRGITARFDAIGLPPTEVEEVLLPRLPQGDEAALFEVTTLGQLIEVQQTFFSGGTIIEAADMVFPASRYEFHYRMEIK